MDSEIREKFLNDPAWAKVEKMLMDFINPLIEMDDIDESQPAEHVKAELIGRKMMYKRICDFLGQTGLVKNPQDYQNKNIFK